MKLKLILAATAFFLLSTISKAQIENLKGVGKYKIGEATASSLIPDLEKIYKIKVKKHSESVYPYKFIENKTNTLLELSEDTVKKTAPLEYNYCKGVKVYFLTRDTIANMLFEKVWLTFYNDTLVKFESTTSTKIEEAFELKYGKGTEDYEKTENPKCVKDDSRRSKTWENDYVTVVSTNVIYYGSDCDATLIQYLNIRNIEKDEFIHKCSKDEETRRKKQADDEKKKGLSDF